jgi:hypothetical protein
VTKELHIALSCRIVAKHANMRSVSIEAVRKNIARLAHDAGTHAELERDKLLREELERRTGLTINELQQLTKEWPQ